MRAVSQFERSVLLAIADTFPDELSTIKAILETVRVCDVESTGVGVYVNFDRQSQGATLVVESGQFGYDGEIEIDSVESGLGAVLDVSGKKLNHLELFTYGDENWDGNTIIESFAVSD